MSLVWDCFFFKFCLIQSVGWRRRGENPIPVMEPVRKAVGLYFSSPVAPTVRRDPRRCPG